MKKNLNLVVFVCLLFLGFQAHSQVYYYSSGKKIPLQQDSLSLFIKYRTLKSNVSPVNNFARLSGLRSIDSIPGKKIFAVKLDAVAKRKEALSSLKKDTNILYVSESFTSEGQPLITTGEILLKLKDGNSIDIVLDKLNLRNLVSIPKQGYYDMVVLKATDQEKIFSIANAIYESGLVNWCHPNFFVPITNFTNDPLYSQQYNLKNTGWNGHAYGIDINIEGAWNITQGCNVRVAVIDQGVENHEDLNGRVLNGNTPLDPAGNGAPSSNDNNHGEACAGIIGATQNNNIGIAGIAPNCFIVPVNIFFGGETAGDLANGINWAWNQGQADVLSNSWGANMAPGFDAIIQAIANARTLGRGGRGSVVVFAAGNNGNTDVSFPGNVDGVITVGACNNNGSAGDIWYYSQRGPSMDLVAPSGDINLLGDFTTIDRMGAAGYEAGNYTNRFGGTSAACPQVSGIAALMLSVNPNLTETQVRTILQNTATDMGPAGFDNTFGYGRANGYAAVNQALATTGMAISGDNSFCTTSNLYSVTNLPAGAIVTWSVNPTTYYVQVNTPNSPQTTLTKLLDANITLTATISNICGGGSINLTKVIPVGAPAPTVSISLDCPDGTASADNAFNPSYYTWHLVDAVTHNETIYDHYGSTINFRGLQGSHIIGASYTNTCGTSPGGITSATCPGSGGGGGHRVIISPNPTSGTVIVASSSITPPLSKTNTTNAPVENKVYQIKVADQTGIVRKIFSYPGGVSTITLNLSDLKSGTYTLQVYNNTDWESHQIIILK